MGATRPHNPAARGELLGRYRALAKSEPNEENKPTLNTKLRILPPLTSAQPVFLRLALRLLSHISSGQYGCFAIFPIAAQDFVLPLAVPRTLTGSSHFRFDRDGSPIGGPIDCS